MYKCDFHVHSTYCDGNDAPRQMLDKAVELGMTAIGFSSHAPASELFEMYYAMKESAVDDYVAEISGLKKQYAGKIDVYVGVECDYFSKIDSNKFDYIIGSVHHLDKNGEFPAVDSNEKTMVEMVNKLYAGDYKQYVMDYYSLLSDVKAKTGCDFVGHFDVVAKFNEGNKYFDENADWYFESAFACADKLLSQGALFEINTGAIARGLKTVPYPAKPIFDYIAGKGGRFVVNSDCHVRAKLMTAYDMISDYYQNDSAIISFHDVMKSKQR